jgi:transcriptional regulator with XRE-family HTH domain
MAKTKTNTAMCERIRQIRKTLGFSQARFGQNIGLSQGHVGALETNVRRINERLIRMLCLAYRVNEVWFRTGEGDMWEPGKDPRMERIWQNFKKLDPFLQECVMQHIDMLASFQEKKLRK